MAIAEPSLPLDNTGRVATDPEVHEVVLRVRYTVDPGDDVIDGDEWLARLRLAGLVIGAVTIEEPSRLIRVRKSSRRT